MKAPRVTVSKLLVLVAVVAANLAVGRALHHDEMMLYGVGPMGLALQVAAFRLWASRGRSRVFWAGFLFAGSSAFAIFACGLTRPWQSSGELWAFDRQSHDLTWGTSFFGFWAGYGKRASEILQPLPRRGIPIRRPSYIWWYDDPRHRIWAGIAGASGLFLTQLVFALAGGLITRQLAKWLGVRPGREGLTAPSEGDAAG